MVDNASRTFNAGAISTNFGYNAWYAQTDWRIRPNITLNLGMRYELPLARSTSPTGFTSFDPNITDPRSGLKGATAYRAIAMAVSTGIVLLIPISAASGRVWAWPGP